MKRCKDIQTFFIAVCIQELDHQRIKTSLLCLTLYLFCASCTALYAHRRYIRNLKPVFLRAFRIFLSVYLLHKHRKRSRIYSVISIQCLIDHQTLTCFCMLCQCHDLIKITFEMSVDLLRHGILSHHIFLLISNLFYADIPIIRILSLSVMLLLAVFLQKFMVNTTCPVREQNRSALCEQLFFFCLRHSVDPAMMDRYNIPSCSALILH